MPRNWKAVPYKDTGIHMKAPTFGDYTRQEAAGDGFLPPKDTAEQTMVATTMLRALEEWEVRVPQGQTYEVCRYAQGMACKLPSGWTVYIPMDTMKLAASRVKAGNDPQGDLELDLQGDEHKG